MNDLNHPLWKLLHRCVALAALGLILWTQASKPDWTEAKVWIGMIVVFLVTDGAAAIVKKFSKGGTA